MLHQLWPKINIYAQDIIKTTVEPKIKETLDMYKMSGFQFAKLRLGTIVCTYLPSTYIKYVVIYVDFRFKHLYVNSSFS